MIRAMLARLRARRRPDESAAWTAKAFAAAAAADPPRVLPPTTDAAADPGTTPIRHVSLPDTGRHHLRTEPARRPPRRPIARSAEPSAPEVPVYAPWVYGGGTDPASSCTPDTSSSSGGFDGGSCTT